MSADFEENFGGPVTGGGQTHADRRSLIGESAARAKRQFDHVADRGVPATVLALELGSSADNAEAPLVAEPAVVEEHQIEHHPGLAADLRVEREVGDVEQCFDVLAVVPGRIELGPAEAEAVV